MKTAFTETTCPVALIVASHPARSRILPWHQQVVRGEFQGVLAPHTLAEEKVSVPGKLYLDGRSSS